MPTSKPFFPHLSAVKKVITPKREVLIRKTCKCGAEYMTRLSRPRQERGRSSRIDSKFNRSPAAKLRSRHVARQASGRLESEAESLLHNLANQFAGDPAATDSTRVLRLPGFANRKLPDEFIVQARQETDSIYTPRDFTIHEGPPETPRQLSDDPERPRSVPNDHKSQSEQDWAYAKRALAPGDDPELVVRRIADFRSEDKPDPLYYARLTVAKARVSLNQAPERAETEARGIP